MALKWGDPIAAPDDDEKLRQAFELMKPLIMEIVRQQMQQEAEQWEEPADARPDD
jgi:hypothetical protein